MPVDLSRSPRVRGLVGAIALLALGLALPAVVSSPVMAGEGPDAAARIAGAARALSPLAAASAGLAPSGLDALFEAIEPTDEFTAFLAAAEAQRAREADLREQRERAWRRGGTERDLAAV